MLRHHSRSEEDNEALLARVRAAICRLEVWGIEVPASSRFQAYVDRFEPLVALSDQSIPQAEIHELQFDLREMDELAAIVESFPGEVGPTARERLTLILSGAEHPDQESSSQARDAQWELYLRALFRRAQIPAGLGNPDVIATVHKTTVPVEAKRPKTEKRLGDRLRKGVSQVENSGHPGVVAISLDQAIRAGRGVLLGPTLPDLEAKVVRLVDELVQRNIDQIVARIRGRPVLGLLFHARVPAWVKPISRPQLITVNQLEVVDESEHSHRILDRLLDGMGRG